ncbi:hypothetical protein Z052_01820 [Halorubrum sp. C191]|uniref:hypothetical protein n=1 Tax=Halorubrum sp. C191 TaxID=1383842 RepID=UPI000C073318|nr:hypothetical protein [Halorubrum sp. C191]PHQ43900.1 hypothetical protein Z052_01820 [Halorubrum sp. C191]
MSQSFGTPYLDDALLVENGTTPDEVVSFVRRRALSPRRVAGMTIWNFNNHELDREQLAAQADDLLNDRYIVPFQVSGAWGFMAALLPETILEAEVLVFDQGTGEYHPYPSYFRHTEKEHQNEVKCSIQQKLSEVTAGAD